MRVISGSLGGRAFDSPKGHRTHPMSEKIRGALFNALGPVDGLTFLDAFAGSGALGFEALSRGAVKVVAIDHDPSAAEIIQANAQSLGVTKLHKTIQANLLGWSKLNPAETFDIVLCDPPFDQFSEEAIDRLTRHVRPGGLLVLNIPGELAPPTLENLQLIANKNYNDAQLAFYRRVRK